MKFVKYPFIGFLLVSVSCTGTNKRLRKNAILPGEIVVAKNDIKKSPEKDTPIKEIEEKLIPKNDVKPNLHRYFVIIASFRNPDNAKNYQVQILNTGFSSEILKNKEGLYRVSVLATNGINIEGHTDNVPIKTSILKITGIYVLQEPHQSSGYYPLIIKLLLPV